MAFEITSDAFKAGELIPKKYTCDGDDVSPPLTFNDIPKDARALVLIMDDPDAPVGTWDHWILYNIPPATAVLAEGLKTSPRGALSGRNSWKRQGYGGPCPPDKEHRYFFKLYALNAPLTLPDGAGKKEVEAAMQGHVIEQAELLGRYDRPR